MSHFLTANNGTLDQRERARLKYIFALEKVFLDHHTRQELNDLADVAIEAGAEESRYISEKRRLNAS